MSEHDFEPIRGLPGDLPEGEQLIWQGAPDWKVMARRVFHVPVVGAYFIGLMAWRVADSLSTGTPWSTALLNALWVTPLAIAGLGLLAGLAWLNTRTTVYTITNRRVVMRFGAALTKAINIPFGIIESADFLTFSGGSGDVSITLKAPNKVAYLQLWPHARPGKLAAPQPTFRSIAKAAEVAVVLANALRDFNGQQIGATVTTTTPVAAPALPQPVTA